MIFLVFLTSMLYVYYTHASSYVVSEGNSGTACDVASNVFNSELGYNNNDDAIVGDNDYDNDESSNNSHQIIVDIANLLQVQLPCSLRTRRASGRVPASPLGIWKRCT